MADLSKPAEATLHHLSAGKPGAPTQQTLQRRQREHITSKVDGRHLRAKGRTVAVNYKVTPAFKEDLYALNIEDFTLRISTQGILDCSGETRSYLLICVNSQDPVAAALVATEVALLPVSWPVVVDHPGPAGASNLTGGVSAATVNHHPLVGPLD